MKSQPCSRCNNEPRMPGRTYGYKCKYKFSPIKKRKSTPAEYKIGRFGFVYIRIGNDWIKSTLTAKEARV